MPRADLPAKLFDSIFRPPTPEDDVPEPHEFIHHRPAQPSSNARDKDYLPSHNLVEICITLSPDCKCHLSPRGMEIRNRKPETRADSVPDFAFGGVARHVEELDAGNRA